MTHLSINSRFTLSPFQKIYSLKKGSCNLYIASSDPNLPALTYIKTVRKGDIFFPFDFHESPFSLLLIAIEDTELETPELDFNTVEPQIYDWIESFNEFYPEGLDFPSHIIAEESFELAIGDTAESRKGDDRSGLKWIKTDQEGLVLFGVNDLRIKPAIFFPVHHSFWIKNESSKSLRIETLKNLSSHKITEGLKQLNSILGHFIPLRIREKQKDSLAKFLKEKKLTENQFEKALDELAQVLEENAILSSEVKSQNYLLSTLKLIWKRAGIYFIDKNSTFESSSHVQKDIQQISNHYGIYYRLINLKEGWFSNDLGPLLGAVDEKPIALLFINGEYKAFDVETQKVTPVKDIDPSRIDKRAFIFYKNLPRTASLSFLKIISFSLEGQLKNLNSAFYIAILVAVLNLFLPFATKLVYNLVIPNNDYLFLYQIASAYLIAISAILAFKFVNEYLFLRINTVSQHNLQLAIFQRILDLPIRFFKRFEIGDLVIRSLGFDNIQKIIVGPNLRGLIEGIFSLLFLIPMFYFNHSLAWITVGVVVILTLTTLIVLRISYACWIDVYHYRSEINTYVYQILNSISKIRTAGKEFLSFVLWEKDFQKMTSLQWRVAKIQDFVNAINWSVMYGGAFILMVWILWKIDIKSESFNFGDFTGFLTAFGMFIQSYFSFLNILLFLSYTGALWKRSEVIFQETPEWTDDKIDPGSLTGKIEINNLSFQYEKESPFILDNINITIEPREFVAIVGASGSGKSTLLKLLLGFEKPVKGAIYYDGKDLNTLDPKKLRQQIGSVLQDSKILGASLRDNIMGGSYYSDEEILNALIFAGFGEDLKLLPTKLETLLINGGKAFSGGQKQRILLAKAIIGKPKILFLDEATSALDNQTQEIVTKNIDQMNITRVVIAHRLSTIQKADKIIVIKDRRVVETGTYEELSQKKGAFHKIIMEQKLV